MMTALLLGVVMAGVWVLGVFFGYRLGRKTFYNDLSTELAKRSLPPSDIRP